MLFYENGRQDKIAIVVIPVEVLCFFVAQLEVLPLNDLFIIEVPKWE